MTSQFQPSGCCSIVFATTLTLPAPRRAAASGFVALAPCLVEGKPASACLLLAVRCDGMSICTIEGLAGESLHPIQQAFVDQGGFQCGICTPGMVLATKALLDENPNPSDDEIKHYMMGNLCRCTGYYKIVDAIRAAAAGLEQVPGDGA
jgi:carbon-monoxide dehydrogenase small subunit